MHLALCLWNPLPLHHAVGLDMGTGDPFFPSREHWVKVVTAMELSKEQGHCISLAHR